MSFLTDVGGKLVQGFLSLDDLVFGQGLVRDGVAGLAGAGRSAAGAVAVSSNVAARAVQLGIQTGAKTAKVTAAALDGLVPGAGVAEDFAARVDRRATAAGERASLLASYGLELVGGAASQARNPLTGEPWLEKQVPRGYGWGDLGADTAMGPLGQLVALPMMVSLDAFEALSRTGAGKMTRAGLLRAVHALLDLLPDGKNDSVELAELRELFVAATSSSEGSVAHDTARLAEALVRLSFGDVRHLRTTIAEGLEDMRQLVENEKLGEVVPGLALGEMLRRRARRIVDHAPAKFLAALEPGGDGRPPRIGAILSALVADAANVRVFVVEYPLALALLATNLGALLGAGTLDASEIEAWVRTDGEEKHDGKKTRPWSATVLEQTLGRAEVVAGADPEAGPFPRSAIWVAQDTVFTYSDQVLGRAKALARVERLFGHKVRERVAADPSLDRELMAFERGEKRDRELRARVAALTAAELSQRWQRADDQRASLRAFERTLYNQGPDKIAERLETLETFLSFVGQALALEPPADTTAADGRRAAFERFEAWANAAS